MLDKAKNVAGQSMPYLRNVNVRWGAIETNDLYTMRFTAAETARFSIRDGDVLVCEGGEPGRCAVWKGGPTDLKFQKAIHRVRPGEHVLSEWVALFLRHETLRGALEGHFTGTTIKHLPAQALSALLLPIPPLAEQRRIVARIEALFARTHRARADLERIALLSKRFRKRLLQTQFDPESKKWPVATLADVSDNHDGSRVPIKESDRAKRRGTLPYYGASGQIDTIDGFLFEGKHILVSEDGANLLARSTPIAFQAFGRFWVNNHAHVLTAKPGMDQDFLEYAIEAHDLTAVVSGSAQPKLTQKALNLLRIPVPTFDEQAKVTCTVQRGNSASRTAEHDASRALALLNRLERSILARAFRGELVSQDPADGPVRLSPAPIALHSRCHRAAPSAAAL